MASFFGGTRTRTRGARRTLSLVQLDERAQRRDGHPVHERRIGRHERRLAEKPPEVTRRRRHSRGRGAPAQGKQQSVHGTVCLVAPDPSRAGRAPGRDGERHLHLHLRFFVLVDVRGAPGGKARAGREEHDGGGRLTQALDELPRVEDTKSVGVRRVVFGFFFVRFAGVVVAVADLEPPSRSRVYQPFQEEGRDRLGLGPRVDDFVAGNGERGLVVAEDHRARESVHHADAPRSAGAEELGKRRERVCGVRAPRERARIRRHPFLLLSRSLRDAPRALEKGRIVTIRLRRGRHREREQTRVVRGARDDLVARRTGTERACDDGRDTREESFAAATSRRGGVVS